MRSVGLLKLAVVIASSVVLGLFVAMMLVVSSIGFLTAATTLCALVAVAVRRIVSLPNSKLFLMPASP